MLFTTIILSLATTAFAAPTTRAARCNPGTNTGLVVPTLPSAGSGTDLPAPASDLSLKYIAIGHGIQNYTCANSTATAVNPGALAVLYDATPLYPGTPGTGLSNATWANSSSAVLWDQAIPLNLQNQAAGSPTFGSSDKAVVTNESNYQADTASPFPSTNTDLAITGVSAKFLGHHYFDAQGSPTFDLSASADGLVLSGTKISSVAAPTSADAGRLSTGAVAWLQLGDNGRGLSNGVTNVYRVVTAGGAAEACSVSGANTAGQVFSVPYVAEYWFYG